MFRNIAVLSRVKSREPARRPAGYEKQSALNLSCFSTHHFASHGTRTQADLRLAALGFTTAAVGLGLSAARTWSSGSVLITSFFSSHPRRGGDHAVLHEAKRMSGVVSVSGDDDSHALVVWPCEGECL